MSFLDLVPVRETLVILFLLLGSADPARATITVKLKNAGDQTQSVMFLPTLPLVTPAGGTAAFVDTVTPKIFTLFDVGMTSSTDAAGAPNAVVLEIGSTIPSASPAPPGQQVVLVMNAIGTNNTTKASPIARVADTACSGSNCLWLNSGQTTVSTNRYYAVPFQMGSVAKIAFYPAEVCQDYYSLSQGSNTANGCGSAGATVQPVSAPTPLPMMQFNFWIGYFEPTTGPTGTPIDSTGSSPYTFRFQSDSPQIDCPTTIVDHYFPGDRSIDVDSSKFGIKIAGGAVGDRAEREAVIVAGKNGAIATFGSTYRDSGANDLIATLPISSTQTVTGFSNSTDADPVRYSVAFMVRDRGGLVTSGACGLYPVETSEVKGFLPRSQCFIATAAYRSDSAWPVRILRQFRDDILARSSTGKEFIAWYYRWSPPKALWLIDHPSFRVPVLLALAPLVLVAWLILNPWVGSTIVLMFTLLMIRAGRAFRMARRHGRRDRPTNGVTGTGSDPSLGTAKQNFGVRLVVLFLSSALASEAIAETSTPFISKIQTQLQSKDSELSSNIEVTSGGSTSWLQREQARLAEEGKRRGSEKKEQEKSAGDQASNTQTPFLDSVLKSSKAGDLQAEGVANSTTPFIDKRTSELQGRQLEAGTEESQESNLGSESAIQAVAEGRSELRLRRPGKIKHAFSVSLGTVATRGLTVVSGGSSPAFDDVYGRDWVADLNLHWEWQPFRHHYAGSLGLFAAGSFSVHSGKGSFTRTLYKPNPSPTVSTPPTTTSFGSRAGTAFSLVVAPVALGVDYRLTLLKYVQPFVMFGGSAVGLVEVRADSNPNRWQSTFGIYYAGGLNLLLDWMSPDMAWEMYDIFRVKRCFLTGQFRGIQTFTGDVRVVSQVVYAGMTFEY